MIHIHQASTNDLPVILELLRQSDLPPDGLSDHLESTLVAYNEREFAGCAALELYGNAALLRSVAVVPSRHGQGIGQQLTDAALDLARNHDIVDVFLLTETAVGYYTRFGFRPIERSQVAPEVQHSVEFTSACPASAQAMVFTILPDRE